MTRHLLVVAIALIVSACSNSSSEHDSVAPNATNTDGTAGNGELTPNAVSFATILPGLSDDANATAELTRAVCLADYSRLATLLATDTATQVFHAPGGLDVDVEWIDSAMNLSATAAWGNTGLQRQGAGAVFSVRMNDGADPVCEVRPYETFGLDDSSALPATTSRVYARLDCAPDSRRDDVTVEDIPLFEVDESGVSHAYGHVARIYTINRGSADEQSVVSRLAVNRVVKADGSSTFDNACVAPGALANGSSVIDAAPDSSDTPGTPAVVPPVASGNGLYLGRPWREAARLAQDSLNAVGIQAMRARLDEVTASLGLHAGPSVELACPSGGSARALSNVTDVVHEHRNEFMNCQLDDGSVIDGEYDAVRRNDDDPWSVSRSLEERYAVRIDSPAGALAVQGTVSDAEKGSFADACGLVEREVVLRIDAPEIILGDTRVRSLAVEDIDNLYPEVSADGGCGQQITRHNFSDSARVEGPLGDGAIVELSVNRTGSVLRDATGSTRSSGQDALIRIYSPLHDDGLDLVSSYEQNNGVRVTINEYPGQQVFADTWDFVAR